MTFSSELTFRNSCHKPATIFVRFRNSPKIYDISNAINYDKWRRHKNNTDFFLVALFPTTNVQLDLNIICPSPLGIRIPQQTFGIIHVKKLSSSMNLLRCPLVHYITHGGVPAVFSSLLKPAKWPMNLIFSMRNENEKKKRNLRNIIS